MSRFINFTVEKKPVNFNPNRYLDLPLVSLKKSLEPIEPYIHRIQDHAKLAWEQCTYPSEYNLTRDESAAIYLYSMETKPDNFYRLFNRVLRSGNVDAMYPWFSYLKLLSEALQKFPSVQRSVWRGGPADLSKAFTEGQELFWSSFSSCSSSLPVTKHFLGSNGTLFMIEVSFGKDISKHAMCPDEKEVLLPPRTSLTVVSDSLQFDVGLQVVHLKETTKKRDLILIGIAGPMGCSRNLYATHLCNKLNSPFEPLMLRSFWKGKFQIKHPKFGTVLCGHAPEAYDANLFATTLRQIRLNPTQSSPYLQRRKSGQIVTPFVIVVEGLLPFNLSDEITSMFDIRIMIQAEQEKCRLTRYRSDHKINVKVKNEDIKISKEWKTYFDEINWPQDLKQCEEQMKKVDKVFNDTFGDERDFEIRDKFIEESLKELRQKNVFDQFTN